LTFTIAVAGKGGVGKSTFAALAIRHLHEKTNAVVLAVDADPNSNLGEKLGIEAGKTVGGIREELASLVEEPPKGMSKQEFLDYQVRLSLREGEGVDLITMGRQEGPGCYCFVNNVLRQIIDSISSKYDCVVIDNEAGMEHLSRRTTRSSDVLFVLCDKSRSSVEAARRIATLATEMKIAIGKKALVFNMRDDDQGAPQNDVPGFDLSYSVRRSGTIQAMMQKGESLVGVPMNDPAVLDVARIVDRERGAKTP
jgi:CO dehydrogenase maturation factor